MSNKTLWSFISQFWPRGRSTFTGSGRSETVCPNGHPMDPSWTSCPRCEAESRAQEPSSFSRAPSGSNATRSGSSSMPSRSPTKSDSSYATDSSVTRYDNDAPTGSSSVRPPPSGRTIVGVLVSYSWDRHGELFVIYEGRNVVGKGSIDSEGGRPCDVQMTCDETMSSEHAHIFYRGGRYQLFDNRSTNGTYLDDLFVEENGVSLHDGARIRMGQTVWTFRKIESGNGGPAPVHTPREEPRHEPRADRGSRDSTSTP